MPIPAPYPYQWPQAVIFDWDNTLVDTLQACHEAYNQTRVAFNHPPEPLEVFYNNPHASLRDSFPKIFGPHAMVAEDFFCKVLLEIHESHLRPLPGAEKLLQMLVGRGLFLGVVSNKNGDILRKEIASLGWESYFSTAVGARDTEADKPSPIPLYAALRESKVSPGHDVWFVGDAEIDMLCAQNAGCVPVSMGLLANLKDAPVVSARDCLGLVNILLKI